MAKSWPSGANLTGADLTGAKIAGVKFERAKLEGVRRMSQWPWHRPNGKRPSCPTVRLSR
ncbi:pentapeptide repeat-containing protein [Streptomyces sp. NPDC003027]